jgi:hypothetical protein
LEYASASFSGNPGLDHDSGHFERGASWLYLQKNTTVLPSSNK